MKFLKSICLFFVYPMLLFGSGFVFGVRSISFFYPNESVLPKEDSILSEEVEETFLAPETLCVDTVYILEETDLTDGSVVETSWKLPGKYIGMDREQFVQAMSAYEAFPPLSERERGFVGLEILSFSRDQVVVQMNYQPAPLSSFFYLAVKDHEVVVYLEDRKTVYMDTGILLDELPWELQLQVMEMYPVDSEEELYDFLETYSS